MTAQRNSTLKVRIQTTLTLWQALKLRLGGLGALTKHDGKIEPERPWPPPPGPPLRVAIPVSCIHATRDTPVCLRCARIVRDTWWPEQEHTSTCSLQTAPYAVCDCYVERATRIADGIRRAEHEARRAGGGRCAADPCPVCDRTPWSCHTIGCGQRNTGWATKCRHCGRKR